jgi:hypothetical protein
MFEQDDGIVAFLLELKTDSCSDPFCGSFDYLPEHSLPGLELENVHVEAADLLAVARDALIPTLCKISTMTFLLSVWLTETTCVVLADSLDAMVRSVGVTSVAGFRWTH